MDEDFFKSLFLYIFAMLIILLAVRGWGALQCSGQWRDSGFNHRYELIAGCMVQRENGHWLPADNIRDVRDLGEPRD